MQAGTSAAATVKQATYFTSAKEKVPTRAIPSHFRTHCSRPRRKAAAESTVWYECLLHGGSPQAVQAHMRSKPPWLAPC